MRGSEPWTRCNELHGCCAAACRVAGRCSGSQLSLRAGRAAGRWHDSCIGCACLCGPRADPVNSTKHNPENPVFFRRPTTRPTGRSPKFSCCQRQFAHSTDASRRRHAHAPARPRESTHAHQTLPYSLFLIFRHRRPVRSTFWIDLPCPSICFVARAASARTSGDCAAVRCLVAEQVAVTFDGRPRRRVARRVSQSCI